MHLKNGLLVHILLAAVLLLSNESTAQQRKPSKNETVEFLKAQAQAQLTSGNDTNIPPPRESTFSVTYIPVFLIVIALVIIIGLYVYDIFVDMIEEGGLFHWTNDTISLHCSDTTTNQFRFLLCASLLFSIGLIILLSREFKYRVKIKLDGDDATVWDILWWSVDLLAAICFAFIGIFPTHGDTTRRKIGKAHRDQTPDEAGLVRCSTVITYQAVVPNENLTIFGCSTCVSRNVSKWIHLFTSLYAMIELTVSNMLYSWWVMPSDDDHIIIFRGLSSFTLLALVVLFTIQGVLTICKTWIPGKARAVLYLMSMMSELGTLLFAVITTMCAILHRDPKVLWIFSTCVGFKT